MAKVRVHELAKEFNIENKEVLDKVQANVNEIRIEQRAYTDTILEAIREGN